MNRREWVTALGCVAAMPLVAAAQQPERIRRVGVFIPSADNREGQTRLQAFARRLQQLGWTEGRNVLIDIRSVAGSAERSREVAAEFVALAPDVILSSGSVSTAVLKRATTTMPVVFAGRPGVYAWRRHRQAGDRTSSSLHADAEARRRGGRADVVFRRPPRPLAQGGGLYSPHSERCGAT